MLFWVNFHPFVSPILAISPIFTLGMSPYGAHINFFNSKLGTCCLGLGELGQFRMNQRAGLMAGFCFSYVGAGMIT